MLISPNNRNYINAQKNKNNSATLKGVLINNHVKNQENTTSFDEIKNSLLIYESSDNFKKQQDVENIKSENGFDIVNAMKPVVAATGIISAGCFMLSAIFQKSSNSLLNSKSFEQLPDLAVNMNIKEEPQFAIYRAIRDPNFKNILGATAIFLMSGITIASKNFVDGAKEVWVKKQKADIERDLQENLIEVEKDAFSGKLNVVNEILEENVRYFDTILNKNSKNPAFEKNNKTISFKGVNDKKEEKKKNLKFGLFSIGILGLR